MTQNHRLIDRIRTLFHYAQSPFLALFVHRSHRTTVMSQGITSSYNFIQRSNWFPSFPSQTVENNAALSLFKKPKPNPNNGYPSFSRLLSTPFISPESHFTPTSSLELSSPSGLLNSFTAQNDQSTTPANHLLRLAGQGPMGGRAVLLGGAASRVNARLQAGRRVGLKYDVSAGQADEAHC